MYYTHTIEQCDLEIFRREQAGRFGLTSIADIIQQYNLNGDLVGLQVADIYPRIAYKIFQDSDHFYDLFVEDWAIPAIRLYYANFGYAGLTLSTFLEKVASERTATQRAK